MTCSIGKLLEDGLSSSLSKRSFLQRFTALAINNHNRKALVEQHLEDGRLSYISLKKAAQSYGEAKDMFQSSFTIARLGQWVKKPLEQDHFEIPYDGNQMSCDIKSETFVDATDRTDATNELDCPTSPFAF